MSSSGRRLKSSCHTLNCKGVPCNCRSSHLKMLPLPRKRSSKEYSGTPLSSSGHIWVAFCAHEPPNGHATWQFCAQEALFPSSGHVWVSFCAHEPPDGHTTRQFCARTVLFPSSGHVWVAFCAQEPPDGHTTRQFCAQEAHPNPHHTIFPQCIPSSTHPN